MLSGKKPLELISKGVRSPGKIVPFVLKQLYPAKYSPWIEENGVITWNTDRGFQWGEGKTQPQTSAINYHIARALREDLAGNEYRHAVEIGCGYGRVTPWLTDHASAVTGLDPKRNVLSLLREYYPTVNIHPIAGVAQDLPLDDGAADLLVTRAVLQHIPPDEIELAVAELKRVATDDADILLWEATDGTEKMPFHPRPVDEYVRLFEPIELVNSRQEDHVDTTREYTRERMLLTTKSA